MSPVSTEFEVGFCFSSLFAFCLCVHLAVQRWQLRQIDHQKNLFLPLFLDKNSPFSVCFYTHSSPFDKRTLSRSLCDNWLKSKSVGLLPRSLAQVINYFVWWFHFWAKVAAAYRTAPICCWQTVGVVWRET